MSEPASCSMPSVIPVSRGRLDALDLGVGTHGRPHRAGNDCRRRPRATAETLWPTANS